MSYTEAKLKSELLDAFKCAGHTCHKFPDLARGIQKPYDLVCGIRGLYVGIETKLVKVGTVASRGRWHDGLIVLRCTDIRTNQHTALRETVAAGNMALVIGAVYDQFNYSRVAFALPYDQFLTREVWMFRPCWNEAIPLTWERGKGWDVSELVERLTGQISHVLG